MGEKIKISLILLLLILIVIIIGNYIHLFLTNKRIQNLERGTYLKVNKENLAILINVDNKKLYLVDLLSNEVIKEYVVATGKAASPTPLGSFKIVEKAKWGGGFGSRWLGLDVPWGKYGIHGTNQPGSIGQNISGGCIRMRNKDVEELYSLIENNTTVYISRGDYGAFAHGFRDLIPGDRGGDVLEVQKRLKIKGYYKDALDGIYGEGMKAGLIEFLRDKGLELDHKINEKVYQELDIILMD